MRKKQLSTLLKIGITLVGLIYVLSRVPLQQIGGELAHIHWPWFLVGFGLVTSGLVLRAYRWLLLLRGLGASVRFKRLVELYFVGTFFNAFLPSGFGGDVVRVLEASQDIPTDVAAGTVIVDRMTGLLMLFSMALVALPLRPVNFPDEWLWLLVVIFVAGLLGGIVLLEGSLIRHFGRWLPGKLSPVGEGPIAKLLRAVQGSGWRAVAGACGVSILFNFMLVGWWTSMALALGYPVTYGYNLLVVPILAVSLLVPSVGGLGVRETIAPILYAGAGLEPSQAVSLALLVFILLRLSGLLGAPVYILSVLRNHRHPKTGAKTTADSL